MEPVSRPDYEMACRELEAPALPDHDLIAMANRAERREAKGREGDYYDQWPLFDRVWVVLGIQRGVSARNEGVTAKPPTRTIPAMCGQLWEDCERCGREPIYQPLFLCEQCWPKAAGSKT